MMIIVIDSNYSNNSNYRINYYCGYGYEEQCYSAEPLKGNPLANITFTINTITRITIL